MKLSSILVGLTSVLGALAASKANGAAYDKYRSQSSSAPLDLDDASYTDLTSEPRDYSVAVLLTAQEAKYGCQLCRDFQPEWNLIAKSWNKGDKHGRSRLLFGTLDFGRGKAIFQKVRFQLCALRSIIGLCF